MADSTHPQTSPTPSPPDPLLQMIFGSVVTQMIAVAARLDIADLVAEGDRSVDELADMTNSHAPSLYRLLRALASVGIFAETEPHHFTLTPLAGRLQSDVPFSLKGFAILFGSEFYYRSWANLLHSVQTGESALELTYGMNLFDYLHQHPGDAAIFNEAMTSVSGREAAAVRDAYDFSGFQTLVDVGGGHGILLTTILKANPSLQGILFDRPPVVAGASALLQQEGVVERCQVVGGDFFTDVPAGADAYILKYILHDWDAGRARRILENCRAAVVPGGRVLVVDTVIPAGNTPFLGKLRDIVMLSMTPGGVERTEAEFQELFSGAGFKLNRVIPTKSIVSIIEGIPE